MPPYERRPILGPLGVTGWIVAVALAIVVVVQARIVREPQAAPEPIRNAPPEPAPRGRAPERNRSPRLRAEVPEVAAVDPVQPPPAAAERAVHDPAAPQSPDPSADRIAHLRRVTREAIEFAAINLDRSGLARCAGAEDELRKAIEQAMRAKIPAESAALTPLYRDELIPASDALTAKVVTDEFVDSIPWTDLLTEPAAKRWSHSDGIEGFEFRLENGIIAITPPTATRIVPRFDSQDPPATEIAALVGIFDQPEDRLRHFVLEMEFSFEGRFSMFFHAALAPSVPNGHQSEEYELDTGHGVFEPNETYRMIARYIGNELSITYPDEKELAPYTTRSSWAKRRFGGIVFKIPSGCRLTVTRMQIRNLL